MGAPERRVFSRCTGSNLVAVIFGTVLREKRP